MTLLQLTIVLDVVVDVSFVGAFFTVIIVAAVTAIVFVIVVVTDDTATILHDYGDATDDDAPTSIILC